MILPLILLAGAVLFLKKGLAPSKVTASGSPGGATPLSGSTGNDYVSDFVKTASKALDAVVAPVDTVVNAVTGNTPADSTIGQISTNSPNLNPGAVPGGTVQIPTVPDPGISTGIPTIFDPPTSKPGTNGDWGNTSGTPGSSHSPSDYDNGGRYGGRYQDP